MHLVMRSLFNLWMARNGEKRQIAVLVDRESGVDSAEYCRLLQPWRSWLTIDGIQTIIQPMAPGTIERIVSSVCQAVVVVSDRDAVVQSVRKECERFGILCIDSTYCTTANRTLWFSQEVAHHDFEIGGVNEWDGQPTQFAQHILRHLSYTHCERVFPKYLLSYIDRLLQRQGKGPLEILDIGCGSISVLRWGVLKGLLSVTGVDPLLEMYAIILERHGLSLLPGIRCQRELCIGAEELSQHVPLESYDFAFTRNAIDHVEDPLLLVRQVAACLRPGGIFALEFNTREGSRENWAQLHKFDLYLDSAGTLMCAAQDGSAHPLVPEDTGLILKEVIVSTETYTIVVLERRTEGEQPESLWQRTNEWRHKAHLARIEKPQFSTRVYETLKQVAKPLYRWAKSRS